MPTLPLQIGAPVFILKCPRMLVLLALPSSASRDSLGHATDCATVLGSPAFPSCINGRDPLEIRATGPVHSPALCFTAFAAVM